MCYYGMQMKANFGGIKMQLENPSVKTIEEVENPAARRVQYGSLIGLLGLLGCYFLLEYRGNGVAWTWMEVYSVIPAMLFMGATLSGGLTRPVRNRLIFGAAFLIWFAVTKALHRIEGVEARSIGVFFCAYGMCLPFAWASGDGKRRRGLKWILGLYLGLGALLVLYGLMLLGGCVPGFLQDAVYWDGTRFSAMSHPNVCAPLLMIGIGVSLMCWGSLNKVWQRVLLILWIGVQFGVLILTSARTTIVFTCVLLGGSLFCALRKSGWKRFAIACLAAVVLMGGLFVGSQMFSKVHKTNMEASQTAGEIKNIQYGWGSDIKNLNNRTEIWSSARKGLRDNPRILLEGTEYSGLILSQYNSFRVYHAHNSWLQVLYDMGLPGLLLALVLTVVVVYDALVLLWYNPEPMKSVAALLVLCILGCSFLEPYLFGAYMEKQPIQFLFLLLSGYLDCWRAELKEKI